ncbi:MAG: GatB/YqeY domain-containing protein [Patescibacteria group bacterium]|jgi:hypothetical protein
MLKDRINKDLITALKAKDQEKSSILRLINSEIKNEEIAKKKREQGLNDEETQAVIARQIKQINDSIESFKAGKREDLVKEEEQKLAILKVYLPKQIEKAEVEKIVDEVIAQVKPSSPSDFGKVMGQVMAKVKGKTDGKVVNELVRKKLNEN